mmetsp:Transcript_22956/g.48117  ORF Transcript_22956/g.48117 Transcript_22956/m.48117 type:complete len:462 (-) Transcript_22956:1596-2981(-)
MVRSSLGLCCFAPHLRITAEERALLAALGSRSLLRISMIRSTLRSSQRPSDASSSQRSRPVSSKERTSGVAMTAPGHLSLVLKSPSDRDGIRSPSARLSTTLPPAASIRRFSSGVTARWSSVTRTPTSLPLSSRRATMARQSPRFAACSVNTPSCSHTTTHTAHVPLRSPVDAARSRSCSSVRAKPAAYASRSASSPSAPAACCASSASTTLGTRWFLACSDAPSPPCPSKTAKTGICLDRDLPSSAALSGAETMSANSPMSARSSFSWSTPRRVSSAAFSCRHDSPSALSCACPAASLSAPSEKSRASSTGSSSACIRSASPSPPLPLASSASASRSSAAAGASCCDADGAGPEPAVAAPSPPLDLFFFFFDTAFSFVLEGCGCGASSGSSSAPSSASRNENGLDAILSLKIRFFSASRAAFSCFSFHLRSSSARRATSLSAASRSASSCACRRACSSFR